MYKIKHCITFLACILILNVAYGNAPKSVEPIKNLNKGAKGNAVNSHPIWQIDTTKGSFLIELWPEKAPKTVANFIQYAESGFYDGTIFHRVIPNFVLQGGGFTKDMTKKRAQASIPNEARSDVKNLRGTLSMARLSDPDSATCQFFINLKDNKNLDKLAASPGYAVFGRVIEGMSVIDHIAYVKTGNVGIYRDVPLEPVEIKQVKKVESPLTVTPADSSAINPSSKIGPSK